MFTKAIITFHCSNRYQKLRELLTIGTSIKDLASHKRNVILTNTIAIIFFLTTIIIIQLISSLASHFNPIAWLFPYLPWGFIIPVILNHFQLVNVSRLLLCCLPPVAVVTLSVIAKLSMEDITFNDYYNFRIALIALSTIPFMVFSLKEKYLLSFSVLICLLCLILSDQIHHHFNVGFYDIGFTDKHYDFINTSSLTATAAIILTIISLKSVIEKQEEENRNLLFELQDSNAEIASQRDELIAQREKLNQNQKALSKAYDTIERQKVWLEEELVMYDFEINQFSYNVAHHLRGPVASISGLINLYASGVSKEELLPHMQSGIRSLDGVVSDLNKVLQVRKDIFRSKSSLSLNKIAQEVLELMVSDMLIVNPILKIDFSNAPHVYAPKSAIVSIFYNLISNALKFRDENTRLVIHLLSEPTPDAKIKLTIRDNGVGLDLTKHMQDIFKMYKRFHMHKEGKGLGLYLVKLQVIALGGTINVSSQLGEFTQFEIVLPKE